MPKPNLSDYDRHVQRLALAAVFGQALCQPGVADLQPATSRAASVAVLALEYADALIAQAEATATAS